MSIIEGHGLCHGRTGTVRVKLNVLGVKFSFWAVSHAFDTFAKYVGYQVDQSPGYIFRILSKFFPYG